MNRRIMPTRKPMLKTVAVLALCAPVFSAHAGPDDWYGGNLIGSWGAGSSLGLRGALPAAFGMTVGPGNGLDGDTAQFGGYRFSDGLAIEGAQARFGTTGSGCDADPLGRDTRANPCAGSAWSLSGIATLPFESGLAVYGRMGLRYVQKGGWDETFGGGKKMDDLAGVYGIGLSYGLSRSVTLHAESEYTTDVPGNTGNYAGHGLGLSTNVHSIGLSIKF